MAQVIALILAPGEAAPVVSAASAEPVASPVAVRVAEQYHVDLRQITPASGTRITKSDVLSYAQMQQANQPISHADDTRLAQSAAAGSRTRH